MPLDTLITGAIATLAGDTGFGWVEAIGITDGRVAFAGSEVELETRADAHTERIELGPDEVAIPGLTDAHLHLADAAIAATQVDLASAGSLDEGLAMIAARAAITPGAAAWIEGGGWDQRRWGRWPTAADLERAVPGRLVGLWSFDHHAFWVSRAALEQAGLDSATPDPPGGLIRRDPAGAPDGVLLENAVPLVAARIPTATGTELEAAIVQMGGELLSLGVVAVHDPGGITADPDLSGAFVAYANLATAGRLPVRIHASFRSEALPTALAHGLRSGNPLGAPDGRARVGWLKLFADGTLGSRTAATLDPIHPDDTRGLFRMTPTELADFAAEAADGGIASQIHAIGDHAVRAALDALEPTVGRVPLTPRLEHVQLVHPDDVGRFAGSGIAASVQPVHLREDAATARRDWGVRAERDAYAWRSLAASGALIPFGTDAPVEPIDPWPGLAMAAARHDRSWPPGTPPFGPGEALPIDRILRAACVDGPRSAGELDRGRLIPGQHADVVVVPVAAVALPIDPIALGSARPRLVLVDGRVAYES
ncbi:MAG: amidohydrolase [Chloroflexota bacterium]